MSVVVAVFFFLVSSPALGLHAQETDSVTEIHAYDLAYYIKTAFTLDEIEKVERVVLARVSALQRKSLRSREENLILLKDAQFLGHLYNAMQDENRKKEVINVFIALRDEFIAYVSKHNDDYEIKTELAFLVHMGFLVYKEEDFYQSVRLMNEIASDVYNTKPNAKVALLLAQYYIGSNKAGVPLMANTLAERYLEEAFELDGGSGYISYLSSIYFANLYYKTGKMHKAQQYMAEAKALYPEGAFAYIVEYLFFENGKPLF